MHATFTLPTKSIALRSSARLIDLEQVQPVCGGALSLYEFKTLQLAARLVVFPLQFLAAPEKQVAPRGRPSGHY